MEPPIINGILSDGVSGLFVVKRSVRSKDVVSVPSEQDILITYSEAVLTSILALSDKIREASENESTSYKMKNKQKNHSVGTILKHHRKHIETETKLIPLTRIHLLTHFHWVRTPACRIYIVLILT